MKRYSLIICMVLIFSLSGVASAQVLMPTDAGGSAFMKLALYGSTFLSGYTSNYLPATIPPATYVPLPPIVGYTSYSAPLQIYTINYTITVMANLQAAFEFNLDATTFPTTMTSKNFTARLGGLTATDFVGAGTFNVDLFDMGDGTEDGNVSFNDFNSTRCNSIASSPHVLGGAPAVFNDIDVTCAVRNDLFGAGQTDFSGFILNSPDATGIQGARFNTNPTLTINPGNPGPDCPGCGDGGGGGCFIANSAR